MNNLVAELKRKENLTNIEVGKILGKSPSRVSEYLHHPKKIPKDVEVIISERLGLEKPMEFECELEDVSIEEVSQRMGKDKRMIQNALRQEKLPFGYAVQGSGKKYQYWIFRGSFERFMELNK